MRDGLCVRLDAAPRRDRVRRRQLRRPAGHGPAPQRAAWTDDIVWVHGNAETVAQPDGSFDFAISEYSAAIWCEPAAWIGEAHRLLRPGGELVFLGNHPLAMVCAPVDGSLPRPSVWNVLTSI
jgi:SAM-dependent methyltransferase